MNKISQKILITGGAGYIGTVLCEMLLQQGHRVKVLDALWFNVNVPLLYVHNPNYEFIKGDIRKGYFPDSILRDVDLIIHAAAIVGEPASVKFPELTQKINYEASVNLISKALEQKVKGFIFFSTCSNYGVSDGIASEETPLKYQSLYAETKVNVEKYLVENGNGLDWVICRLSTVYGASPRMRFDLTVNDFTAKAYMEKYLDIFLPYSYRPYIHVSDAARVVIEIVKNFEKLRNNVFNIGFNGENYQKIQVAEIVKKLVPETKIEIVKSGADLRNYQVGFSKLQEFLNIKNAFTVEDGVKEVLRLLEDRTVSDPYESCYYNTTPALEAE